MSIPIIVATPARVGDFIGRVDTWASVYDTDNNGFVSVITGITAVDFLSIAIGDDFIGAPELVTAATAVFKLFTVV